MKSKSIFFLLTLFSSYIFSQVPEMSSEFLNSLPPSVRSEIEVKNQLEEDSEIEKLFASDTSLEKNKILLEKIKKQLDALDDRFNGLEDTSSNEIGLERFGSQFFRTLQSSFMPVNVPNISGDYVLGPGDRLLIMITGNRNQSITVDIERDNSIVIEGYGKVSIGGMSLTDGIDTIKDFLKRLAPSVEAAIQLVNQRDIQILILGYVESPGIYTLSSGASMLGAIDVAGGILPKGSYRNILHKRNGKVIQTVDLYDIFVFGNFDASMRLSSGDVLYISPKGLSIPVSGGVNTEAIFEINQDENIDDVIRFAGGFSEDFEGFNSLILSRTTFEKINYLKINKLDFEATKLQARDALIIPSFSSNIDSRVAKTVNITGRVKIPGKYTFREGDTLSDVIKLAGGYEDNAYTYGSALFRESAKAKEEIYAQLNYSDTVNFIISNIGRPGASVNSSSLDLLAEELRSKRFDGRIVAEFNIDKLASNPSLDLEIESGDTIIVPPIQKVVYMFGDFRNPSNITYNPNNSVADYIKLAGGTKDSAFTQIIVIDPDGKTNIYNNSFISLLDSNTTIYPGSIIYAPRNIGKLSGVMYASTVAPILSSLAISLASLNSIKD